MKINKNQLVYIAIIAIALIASGVTIVRNSKLKGKLNDEKIRSEALLSEKLQLAKSFEKLSSDLSRMEKLNADFTSKIEALEKQLEQKSAEIKRINANQAALRAARVKVKELENSVAKLSSDLETAKANAEREKNKLAAENQNLNDKVAALQKENEQLKTSASILRAMASNNHRVEAVRGKNDRLTVRAGRAQRLVFAFELPNDIETNLSFNLTTPDGKKISSKSNQNAIVNISPRTNNFFEQNPILGNVGTKTIEIVYKREEKLAKGTYVFDVYNNEKYIGSSRFRLR